jgi:hypothetical protein
VHPLGKLTRGRDVTNQAHKLVPIPPPTSESSFPLAPSRSIVPATFFDHKFPKKPKAVSLYHIKMEGHEFSLSAMSQLVDRSQTRFIAEAIYFLALAWRSKPAELKELVDSLTKAWEQDVLNGEASPHGFLAAIRPVDLGMVLNRIRGIKVQGRGFEKNEE